MATIDIFLVLFLFIGVFNGMRNGLFVEFSSFVGLLIGLWAALRFSEFTRDFLGEHLGSNPKTAYIFAFIITFIAVVAGISVLAKLLTKVADFSGLGIFNKIGGGMFGFVRALLILSVLLNIFEKVNFMDSFASPETIANSKLYGPTKAFGEVIYPFLKEELHNIRIPAN
ncbi:CvpA family protein [Flavobacterium sp.]|uniref:CvpA family protein n=1 Tax=Flavobacterium sp. TaxID=239 RepID=UPI0025C52858|nr:CvpA family protein [Flavobacterium sp.]